MTMFFFFFVCLFVSQHWTGPETETPRPANELEEGRTREFQPTRITEREPVWCCRVVNISLSSRAHCQALQLHYALPRELEKCKFTQQEPE